jgi:hypothetical protein
MGSSARTVLMPAVTKGMSEHCAKEKSHPEAELFLPTPPWSLRTILAAAMAGVGQR